LDFLFSAFEDPEYYVIVTVLCTGGELFDRVIKEKKFTERRAANFAKVRHAAALMVVGG